MGLSRGSAVAAAVVCLLFAVLLAPATARAQNPDHDLKLLGLSADEPLKRTCSNALSASIEVLGIDDITLPSGAVEVQFSYEHAADDWRSIGALTVTFDPATDGPFAAGRTWPADFPSAGDAALQWRPPAGIPDTVRLRAEAVYTPGAGVDDEHPDDNSMTASFETEPATCNPGTGGRPCFFQATLGKTICFRDPDFIDPERLRIEIDRIKCLADPQCRPRIPICQVVGCNPCLSGLSCPPGRPFDILIEYPPEFLEVGLIGPGGEVIARADELEQPITRGDRTFRQALSFKAEKGVQYSLDIRPGEAAEEFAEKFGETTPLNFDLRSREGFVNPDIGRFDRLNRERLELRRDLRGLRLNREFDR
jgi:hypothetical protein